MPPNKCMQLRLLQCHQNEGSSRSGEFCLRKGFLGSQGCAEIPARHLHLTQ